MKKFAVLTTASVVILLGGVSGYVGAKVAWNELTRQAAVIEVQNLQNSLETIASRDGKPKDYARMLSRGRSLLALHLLVSAQSFASIEEPQWRDEVVRIAKLVDNDPSLQDADNAWAADARKCLIQHANIPELVESCVGDSKAAPEVVGNTMAGI